LATDDHSKQANEYSPTVVTFEAMGLSIVADSKIGGFDRLQHEKEGRWDVKKSRCNGLKKSSCAAVKKWRHAPVLGTWIKRCVERKLLSTRL
jgi:hypothetical protein